MKVNQVAPFTTTACATNAGKKVIMPKFVHRSAFHRLHGRQDSRGATTGEGEPCDGRVSGRVSERGYWYVHGQLISSYGVVRYWCYAFLYCTVFCRASWYSY